MKDVSDKNFGVIIAFWLPGSILLWGLSYSNADIATWLAKSSGETPSIGGFLYATIASLALGLIISAVRWLTIDTLLRCVTHLPAIDFSKLKDKDIFVLFQGIVDNHYRYYQYYSNTLVAVALAFAAYVTYAADHRAPLTVWIAVVVITIILLLASRDALRKYHDRAAAIAN
jgi:hypothetical protein